MTLNKPFSRTEYIYNIVRLREIRQTLPRLRRLMEQSFHDTLEYNLYGGQIAQMELEMEERKHFHRSSRYMAQCEREVRQRNKNLRGMWGL